ncbi:Kar4p ASCRUDRAFT_25904, partial [Ascoidea rubescens DSM 1968]
NDYSNNYIHSNIQPINYVRNIKNPVEGYPKLQKLFNLKNQQIKNFQTKPYGCRIEPLKMVSKLNEWINMHNLCFDVIMIGSLSENQFLINLIKELPIDKLCSKPGFLFIWASNTKIKELSVLLNGNNGNAWSKKFRRSEELVFVPINKNSKFYPKLDDLSLFERQQWHCWMCITGTVRRSVDGHLIHCNVDTDLKIENQDFRKITDEIETCIPTHLYKVAENFSSATRRLHIIPGRVGYNSSVKVRPGWVIMSPDILLNNFNPEEYKRQIDSLGSNLPQDEEIENLRPKTPLQK